MNVNPLLMTLQSKFRVPIYPIAAEVEDQQDEYIAFQYLDERPVLYSDDTDTYGITSVRVYWYTPFDPQPLKRRLRRALRALDGTICDTDEGHDIVTHLNYISVDVDFYSEIDDSEPNEETEDT